MRTELELATVDEFLDAMRGPLKDVQGVPYVGEHCAVMQYSVGGRLVAQAVYVSMDPAIKAALQRTGEFSKVRGPSVRVRYELASSLLPAGRSK